MQLIIVRAKEMRNADTDATPTFISSAKEEPVFKSDNFSKSNSFGRQASETSENEKFC